MLWAEKLNFGILYRYLIAYFILFLFFIQVLLFLLKICIHGQANLWPKILQGAQARLTQMQMEKRGATVYMLHKWLTHI